ncbi:MAG: MBL fold metallo-hydrolase [Anaerolineales bacterium]|jgi:glyoxylase-like metal-dependent hydrolase (beta-lactamase superfamily II)
MIQRERVAENVYSFQSESYAQVTAGAVIGQDWAIVIDTLAYPEETLAIRDFIEQELKVPVRYVINTHSHADHSWGNCFFPGALVLSSHLCRELLEKQGVPALESLRKQNSSFRNSQIVLPHVTFKEGSLSLRVQKKTLTMIPLPGHSPDGTGILIEEDRVLYSGDVFMPLPYIVDGDIDVMIASLKKIGKMGLENIIQGHGDIVLRGEIEGAVKDNLAYLSAIRKAVRRSARRKYPGDLLVTFDVESCGKSRVLIGGLAEELHQRNLQALYKHFYEEEPQLSESEDDKYY